MRYPTGDLAILSAEVYSTPGIPFVRAAASKKSPPPNRVTEEGPRKRARTQPSTDSAERDDEEKKRARGRPRLDVKDETAADVSCRCRQSSSTYTPLLPHLQCDCILGELASDLLSASADANTSRTAGISQSEGKCHSNSREESPGAKGRQRRDEQCLSAAP